MPERIERNLSPKSPRDIEAEGLEGRLSQLDLRGEVNLDHIRHLRTKLIAEWLRDGYDLHLFSNEEGLPIILGRNESGAMFDDEGNVTPGTNVRYRFYLDTETKDVTVPAALAGEVPRTIDDGTVTIFDTTSAEALEAAMGAEAGTVFTEDMEWLVRQFGRSLSIVRGLRVPTRLETDERVIAIALNDLALFHESDF